MNVSDQPAADVGEVPFRASKAARTIGSAGKYKQAVNVIDYQVHGLASPFAVAFQETLKNPVERRILVELFHAGREIRYEELRRAISTEEAVPPQTFKNAVERLSARAAIDRRLEPQGDRYLSYLSSTKRGSMIAEVLAELARSGKLPRSLPEPIQRDLGAVFLGQVPAAT